MKHYDRIFRSNCYSTQAYIELPSDLHRYIFHVLISVADDFGNLENEFGLWHWVHGFVSTMKKRTDLLEVISRLCESDLVRSYTVDKKQYLHIPKFNNSRRWQTRIYPKSPFEQDVQVPESKNSALAKRVERQKNQVLIEMSSDDTPTTAERSSDCRLRGVGVGVGVKDKTIRSQARGEDYPPGFSEFWETYPRRQAKANAYKAWKRIKPDRQLLDLMKAAIARQKRSEAWQRESGQFIPHPASWLNARRWEDEPVRTATEYYGRMEA